MALAHIPISPDPISETKAVLGKMLFEQLERMDPSSMDVAGTISTEENRIFISTLSYQS